MSNPTPQPSFHPTRQQIDELEALMQRMLALPVQPLDGEGNTAPVPEPLPEIAAEMPLPAFPQKPEPPAPVSSAWLTATEPTLVVAPLPQSSEFSTFRAPAVAPALEERSPPVRRRPALAWWARPLLWSNRVFDRGTVPLGNPGRWLRGRRGRTWLGYSGLVFLTTAVAWSVLDWMGWL